RSNIKSALKDYRVDIRQRHGVIVLFFPEGTDDEVAEAVARRVADVPGIVLAHLARRVPKDPEAITKAAVELIADSDEVARKARFAVRSRRRDKRFPLRSNELDRLVGGTINDTYGLPVDLRNPEL